MNYRGAITKDIGRLLDLFSPHCAERESFDWLRGAMADQGKWHQARRVFNQIRNKSLKAERTGNTAATAQYLFEEICAKTLYNLSGASAPFDADSSYWVLPNAIAFGRRIGINEAEVVACLTLLGE